MIENSIKKSYQILFVNTFAFMICFAAWTINGVLVTYLVETGTYNWNSVQVGWLLGLPILSGSIFRFPVGMLTDKYGGRIVFSALLFFCSIPMFLLSYANSFEVFAFLSFLFGLTGASFASGIAFTSLWFTKDKQGTALGIFGVGNIGTALTVLFAPSLLEILTENNTFIEGWRTLPKIYSVILAFTGILFVVFTQNKFPNKRKSFKELFDPLKNIRPWRFGLYYFLVFGCFVAFSQWLIPYYVNAYYLPLVTAGFLTSLFSVPAGLFRALGGWLSDMFGARKVMYGVFGASIILSFLLIFPRMEIYSPGYGVIANRDGKITRVEENFIEIDGTKVEFMKKGVKPHHENNNMIVLPKIESWQEPVVSIGKVVKRKELIARGVTRIFFQANVWIFTGLVFLIGIAWGIGMGGVYKFIPEYFPNEVGVVGGAIGVLGGLGGFFFPIVFGYTFTLTGIWTSSWFLVLVLSIICFSWFTSVVTKMLNSNLPELTSKFESAG